MNWGSRIASAASVVFGIGLQISGFTARWVGIGFMALGVLLLVATWRPVADRVIPRISLSRPAPGSMALIWAPPPGAGKRRLRRDALALAKEMQAYLATNPPGLVTSPSPQLPEDEAARHEAWEQYTAKITEQFYLSRNDLAARFGGKAKYVLSGLQQRGIITSEQADEIEWFASSLGWLHEAASAITAAALRL